MESKEGWFIDAHEGNIKEQYHFIEKLASGGFGIVYLAEHRKTGKYISP
jgi:serine/threonine protein kinase